MGLSSTGKKMDFSICAHKVGFRKFSHILRCKHKKQVLTGLFLAASLSGKAYFSPLAVI